MVASYGIKQHQNFWNELRFKEKKQMDIKKSVNNGCKPDLF